MKFKVSAKESIIINIIFLKNEQNNIADDSNHKETLKTIDFEDVKVVNLGITPAEFGLHAIEYLHPIEIKLSIPNI